MVIDEMLSDLCLKKKFEAFAHGELDEWSDPQA